MVRRRLEVAPALFRRGRRRGWRGRLCNAKVITAGHAFVQNLRRGHYELAVHEPANRRLAVAFEELSLAI